MLINTHTVVGKPIPQVDSAVATNPHATAEGKEIDPLEPRLSNNFSSCN